ncbi:MAG: threonine synthase [Bacteroidota bacterium]
MKFYSTNDISKRVSLRQAILQSLPPDNGLYMPVEIPNLENSVIRDIRELTLPELASRVSTALLSEDLSESTINQLCQSAINFPAPLIDLDEQLSVLELWHGPSLAFKDFGARYMAALMSELVRDEERTLTILVATSGDTGGAVAAGFLGVPNVEVIILYPSGRVSPLQEKQLTTLGHNITALEIDGTFDDCQTLVKTAFLDAEVNDHYLLSSANSINISRLIPQSFYYFEAYRQWLERHEGPLVFCIPSGNFGNLTAGLLAKKMGLPIHQLIAATNANDVVPRYLQSGEYSPRPSQATISNAMDVGAPSNFRRMEDMYGHMWKDMTNDIVGYSYTDGETKAAILDIKSKYDYTMDPHGAVGFLAAKDFQKQNPGCHVIILETAHPAKFLPVMNPILGEIDIPDRLAQLSSLKKTATPMSKDYAAFRTWILRRASLQQ